MSVSEIKQELSRLTNKDRIQLAMWLWESIDENEVESPAWHGEILAERAAKIESGDANFLSVEQLRDRLRR
ncbi:MAG: addiction module protein [Spartobacteria bacterium]